ncbi:MAG: EamA family transporter, partial [Berryella intestinalis]|nr:EamA family transporter [Berryella intestinalis]
AYGLFLHGVSIVGGVESTMLGAAEPVSATVFPAILLGTVFVWADWLGLMLMLGTIVLVGLPSKRIPRTTEPEPQP